MIRSILLFSLGLGFVSCIDSSTATAGRTFDGYVDADLELASPWPDPTGTKSFGISVAVENGVALVGAPRENRTGQAHLYDSLTGDLLRTLVPNDGINIKDFGRHVALDQSYALLSSSNGTYVYDLATYSLLHILPTSATSVSGSQRIDVDLGRAVIANGLHSLVYDLQSGEKLATIVGYSSSVAISGAQVIVGDITNGWVSVYDWRQGTRTFKLRPENLPDSSGFGTSVAADEGRLIVGATGVHSSGEYHAGSAYVFDLADGQLTHHLEGSRTGKLSSFGVDVAVEGNTAIVSAFRHSDTFLLDGATHAWYEFDHGAAYAFALDSGKELNRFTTLGEATSGLAFYGFSVDYDGQQLIAGTLGWPKKAYLTTFLVPEPHTLGLLVLASICVTCVHRRRWTT